MNEKYDYLNNNLKNIHNLMRIIKDNPNTENRNKLWNYYIINKIDINRTAKDNKNIIINNGFGFNGFIVQIFSIFKDNINFF
jgi:hypothetical protein